MALTLKAEQQLRDVGLIKFFEENEARYRKVAEDALAFLRKGLPPDTNIRPDDIAHPLLSLIEVDEPLRAELSEGKLKQKYWFERFTDLIIDRVWEGIATQEDNI